LFIFCRLNHDSNEFILESGTVANTKDHRLDTDSYKKEAMSSKDQYYCLDTGADMMEVDEQ
jgi:hypothetical protein